MYIWPQIMLDLQRATAESNELGRNVESQRRSTSHPIKEHNPIKAIMY